MEHTCEYSEWDNKVNLDLIPELSEVAGGHAQQECSHDDVSHHFTHVRHEVQKRYPDPILLLLLQVDQTE